MKININSSVLRDGLNKVLTVIDKKNARPILTNCLINAENGRLELVATDLEVTAKVILDSKISEDGSFCINTKNFYEILKELPNADVEMDINQENNILELNCEKINYSLLITNSDDLVTYVFTTSSYGVKGDWEPLALNGGTWFPLGADPNIIYTNLMQILDETACQ